MSVMKLIEEQAKLFGELEKRFAGTIAPKDFEKRVTEVTERLEKQIKERIESLEKRKAAAAKRYDMAIEAEKKALEEVNGRRVTTTPKKARAKAGGGKGKVRAVDDESGKAPA